MGDGNGYIVCRSSLRPVHRQGAYLTIRNSFSGSSLALFPRSPKKTGFLVIPVRARRPRHCFTPNDITCHGGTDLAYQTGRTWRVHEHAEYCETACSLRSLLNDKFLMGVCRESKWNSTWKASLNILLQSSKTKPMRYDYRSDRIYIGQGCLEFNDEEGRDIRWWMGSSRTRTSY